MGDLLGIVQEIDVWPLEQVVYSQPRIHPGEWDAENSLKDFEIQTDHLISARWPDLELINKKKRTYCIVNFDVPEDRRVKIKESEKIDEYLDLAWELKKQWNMGMTVIPIVVVALGTVQKGVEKRLQEIEIRGRIKTIQTTAVLKSARIVKFWRPEETCCHFDSSERPPANAREKTS